MRYNDIKKEQNVMDDKNVKEAIHNQHDKGYKFLLSSKRVFIELLRSFVKQEWVNDIDEANVVKVDKSFYSADSIIQRRP
ncbi:MAG: hypothetical protein XD49_1922 [Caldanaerobacter subterraneus]|nr:MAG: hypothetical protein XD49_1922 [Caldanaerobacter subterraneus]